MNEEKLSIRIKNTEIRFNDMQSNGMDVIGYSCLHNLTPQQRSDLLDRTHYCLVGGREH